MLTALFTACAEAVQKLPNFDYFEPDGVVTAYAQAQLDANKK